MRHETLTTSSSISIPSAVLSKTTLLTKHNMDGVAMISYLADQRCSAGELCTPNGETHHLESTAPEVDAAQPQCIDVGGS
jgi:hypothetical protein